MKIPAEESFNLQDFPRQRRDKLLLPETPQFDDPAKPSPEISE